MRFITTVFGNRYIPMIYTFLHSIQEHHRDDNVSIYYNDIGTNEILILKKVFPQIDFLESKIKITTKIHRERVPLKLKYWVEASANYLNEKIWLLDVDMVLTSNLTGFILDEDDVIYTWKNEQFPLNTGIVFLKNSDTTYAFMINWLSETEKIVTEPQLLMEANETYGAADQKALALILKEKDYNNIKQLKFNGKSLKFKGVECKYLNEVHCGPITETTHVIHYKGGWQPILLANGEFTQNRPKEACMEMYRHWQRIFKESINNILKTYCLKSAMKHKVDFSRYIEGYEERGVLNSEMLLLCSCLKELNIALIIESGRYRGQSTEMLAKFFEGNSKVKIISIELKKDQIANYVEEKLNKFKNLELLYGDSKYLIPKILSNNRNRNVAIFFDGPKGKQAVDIFKELIIKFPNVSVGFFHDMRKPNEKMLNPGRQVLEDSFERTFFTDDNDYIDSFKDLDETCLPKEDSLTEHTWRPYLKGFNKIGSYGPTLAMVLPLEKERIVSKKKSYFSIFRKLKVKIKIYLKKIRRWIFNK